MRWLFFIAVVSLAAIPAKADSCSAVECVQIYAAHYHVPPKFISALIDVESGWNPRAVSPKGAMGLMQLMPATARRFGAFAPFDVEENIAAGTRYVTVLMWEFHGDLRLVAAAYYAGENRIAPRELSFDDPDVVAYVRSVRLHYMLRSCTATQGFRRPLP
ncbi:MAG TPA: transglycosylase SLT domain-containing protein [Terracidiphilus sp.]|nr:transglycosylase SLT domain-containing protein [Terracidiphilus sp.]